MKDIRETHMKQEQANKEKLEASYKTKYTIYNKKLSNKNKPMQKIIQKL